MLTYACNRIGPRAMYEQCQSGFPGIIITIIIIDYINYVLPVTNFLLWQHIHAIVSATDDDHHLYLYYFTLLNTYFSGPFSIKS